MVEGREVMESVSFRNQKEPLSVEIVIESVCEGPIGKLTAQLESQ